MVQRAPCYSGENAPGVLYRVAFFHSWLSPCRFGWCLQDSEICVPRYEITPARSSLQLPFSRFLLPESVCRVLKLAQDDHFPPSPPHLTISSPPSPPHLHLRAFQHIPSDDACMVVDRATRTWSREPKFQSLGRTWSLLVGAPASVDANRDSSQLMQIVVDTQGSADVGVVLCPYA